MRALRIVCAETSEIIERIAHAATLARNAAHPALLSPLQIVRGRGQIGIATSDVPGVTLSELMQRAAARSEAIPQAVALRIALDIIAGLQALEAAIASTHGGAALYGGLTPDSILVGADGQTRLLDPGVQAAAARQSVWRDDVSLLQCTAPELTADGARYDVRADVFSIGVIVWQMLSGHALFARKTAEETIDALRHAPIARAQRVRFMRGEPVARAVASAVDRALQRDRAARLQNYLELAAALQDVADAASLETVAAYVAEERSPSPEPSALQIEARRNEPTLEVDIEAETVPPPAQEIAELDAPPVTSGVRVPRWLIACAAVALVALAIWLFAASDFRAAAPHTARVPSATVIVSAPNRPQVPPVAPAAPPALITAPETPTETPQPPPERASDRPAATSLRAQRIKAAALRTPEATAHKPASKLFIPNDI
jgi:serine/threonine protein kinase